MARLFLVPSKTALGPAVSYPKRQLHLDLLKLLGAQLIVWHHFSLYGPAAQVLHAATPGPMAWLYEYARMAVQIFLVVGGFLAAQHLSQAVDMRWPQVKTRVWLRYRRLVLPFMAAMLLAVISAAVSRAFLPNDGFVPDAPTALQVLAHALLLHDVLGQPALSTGVWYVAIDLQLFALLTALLWLGSRLSSGRVVTADQPALSHPPAWPALTWALVAGLAALSLLVLNRMAALDAFAPYFFGAYGLGVLAYGITRNAGSKHWLLLALICMGVLALVVDYRERIVLALGVAVVLALGEALPWRLARWPAWLQQLIARGGQISYAQFLNHFALLMLANAGFAQAVQAWTLQQEQQIMLSGLILVAYWLLSLWLGAWFERYVEVPLTRWRAKPA